jgi:hypothetical protein
MAPETPRFAAAGILLGLEIFNAGATPEANKLAGFGCRRNGKTGAAPVRPRFAAAGNIAALAPDLAPEIMP